jgi:hypothetical protein
VVLNVTVTRVGVLDPFNATLEGAKLQLTVAEAPVQEKAMVPL